MIRRMFCVLALRNTGHTVLRDDLEGFWIGESGLSMLGGGAGAGVARKLLVASQCLGTGLTFELPLLDIFFSNLTFLVCGSRHSSKIMLVWHMDASLVFGVCLQSRHRQRGICCCFPDFSRVSVTLLASRWGIDWEITLNALPHVRYTNWSQFFFLFIVLLLEKHIATTQIEISSFLFIVLLLGKRNPFMFWLTRLTILKKHLGVLFFPPKWLEKARQEN